MNPVLSNLFVLAFTFTTLFADLSPPAMAADPSPQYSAYRRPGEKAWDRKWTPALMQIFASQRKGLEAARDVENFCPGYHAASEEQKNNCFLRLISGITAWESTNNPREVGDGGRSIGLMQVNTNECKKYGYDVAAMKVPANNLKCGVAMAARLIARDGVISSEGPVNGRWGTQRVKRMGLGRGGWSVMMYDVKVRINGKLYQVGRLEKIGNGMMSYKNHQMGSIAVLDSKRKRLVARA